MSVASIKRSSDETHKHRKRGREEHKFVDAHGQEERVAVNVNELGTGRVGCLASTFGIYTGVYSMYTGASFRSAAGSVLGVVAAAAAAAVALSLIHI